MRIGIIEAWLETEFTNENTKRVYRLGLKRFIETIGIGDMEQYLTKDKKQIMLDVKRFLASLNGSPPTTINTYSNPLYLFLKEHGVAIDSDEWKKLRRRRHLPKS